LLGGFKKRGKNPIWFWEIPEEEKERGRGKGEFCI